MQSGRGDEDDDAWLDVVGSGSEMAARVAAFAWEQTPLGDASSWPVELRTVVQLCLTTRFPMLVTWGPELSMIYNDGYRDMIGDKHPEALGAPFAEVRAEIWDVIGPMADKVMTTKQPTWSELERLLINRRGFLEETFFTFSYSPALDRRGRPYGLIDVATEMTDQVLARRRSAALAALGEAVFSATQVTGVCLAAVAALARLPGDVVNADVFLRVADEPVLIASTRKLEQAAITPAELRTVLEQQTVALTGPATIDGAAPPAGVAVRLGGSDNHTSGVLYVEPAPTVAFSADYEVFLEQVAATIGRALTIADARAVELGEQRHINETLQRAMLQPANDHPTVAARYRPAALNLAVGGDWYDVIDLDDHRRAMVVGDCVGHGLDAATTMGQLRSAARSLLLDNHDPAAVLERLDVFSGSIPGAFATSVACVVIDRLAGSISYSTAGHPPPLLIHQDGPRWLEAAGGCLLQVLDHHDRPLATANYSDGDLLVLYTDGLVERRGETIDDGLDRLATTATQWHERNLSASQTADGLLRELLPTRGDDDVVLVVKRLVIDPPDTT
jgi:serine phosphatase RsbU (regulator of sigma subunit)